GAVVLPETVDEIIGERRDRGDRPAGTDAGRAPDTFGERVRVGVVVDEERIRRPFTRRHARALPGIERREGPDVIGMQIVLLHRSGPSAGRSVAENLRALGRLEA